MANFNSRSSNAIKKWDIINNARVKLEYNDGGILWIRVDDFHRAFGCIVSAPKEDVERDFAVDPETLLYREPKIEKYDVEGDKVKLTYTDGDSFFISKENFEKAYHCILSTTKNIVKNDFAI